MIKCTLLSDHIRSMDETTPVVFERPAVSATRILHVLFASVHWVQQHCGVTTHQDTHSERFCITRLFAVDPLGNISELFQNLAKWRGTAKLCFRITSNGHIATRNSIRYSSSRLLHIERLLLVWKKLYGLHGSLYFVNFGGFIYSIKSRVYVTICVTISP